MAFFLCRSEGERGNLGRPTGEGVSVSLGKENDNVDGGVEVGGEREGFTLGEVGEERETRAVSEFRSFGGLEVWSFGVLEFWSFGVLEFWS